MARADVVVSVERVGGVSRLRRSTGTRYGPSITQVRVPAACTARPVCAVGDAGASLSDSLRVTWAAWLVEVKWRVAIDVVDLTKLSQSRIGTLKLSDALQSPLRGGFFWRTHEGEGLSGSE